MQFKHEYGLDCAIVLRSSREAIVDTMHQWRTYRNSLGTCLPGAQTNDWIVEGCLAEAKKLSGLVPIMIEPYRRDYELKPGDRVGETSLGGRPAEWLPSVCCLIVLSSRAIGDIFGQSRLAVLWYQDQFAMPIAPEALAWIETLDWESLAVDEEW